MAFRFLLPHHRADAGAPGGAVQVVDHRRKEHLVLAGAADAGDAHLRVLEVLLELPFGVPDGGAPQVGGVAQFGHVVVDKQVDRLGRPALEDDHVPAGHLQLGAPVAAGIAARDGAGERALGDHRVATAGAGHGACERAGGPDDLVVADSGSTLAVDLLHQVFGGQATRAIVARASPYSAVPA